MRNLLGRLNARSPDDLVHISRMWQVPLPGSDRGRHVGALYRAMTDVRHARAVWERLDPNAQTLVRDLALAPAEPRGVAEIATLTGLSDSVAREVAIRLYRAGMLAREGDNQELPIGAIPRLFLPRELAQVFRRVQDEIDAGDLSGSSLRVLLETLDDTEIEEAATTWGIRVIPGLRRRGDLIGQILRQVASPERIERVVAERSRSASAIWSAVREAEARGPVPLRDAIEAAGLAMPDAVSPDAVRAGARIQSALSDLESALLVFHTYRRDGSRWLFVPREIAQPGEVATTLPLRPLQPLAAGSIPEPDAVHPAALAWDLLTVLREIAERGAPVWVPGEAISRAWQRRLNRRLWRGGDDVPPKGYLGFLLHLGAAVGLLGAADGPVAQGADKGAIRPQVTPTIRAWRGRTFDDQMERLGNAWLDSEQWIEGREREEIDIWGADWRGFRHRLLADLEGLDTRDWLGLDDLSNRLAEANPTMIGSTFTASSARSGGDREDHRTAAIAQVVAVELETAAAWFGIVELGVNPGKGLVVRVVDREQSASKANEADREGTGDAARESAGAELSVTDGGMVTLHRPTPLHIWSLSAFADAEGLKPEARFQLRPGSVGRALGAGFDLDQIVKYLSRQSGERLPRELETTLRDWTVGYRRVRMRRAIVLTPDAEAAHAEIREALEAIGLEILETPGPDGGLIVLLPASGDQSSSPEDEVLAVLRAHGYAGQWEQPPRLDPAAS